MSVSAKAGGNQIATTTIKDLVIGDQREHPPNKFDPGVRLARLALKQSHGMNGPKQPD